MLIDNQVTRFPNGVTNATLAGIFASLRQPVPFTYHEYREDFDYYAAANWTVTVVGTSTPALVSGNGGLLALTNSAANGDLTQIQKVGPNFLMVPGTSSGPGKKLFMTTRFKVDDATLAAFAVGLQVTNTDGTGAVTDGLYFVKAAATTSVSINSRLNTTTGAQTAVVGTIASDTFIILEAFYDGLGAIYYALNGTPQGYLTVSATSGIPDAVIQPVVVVKNGSGVSRVLTIDRLWVAQEN